jgi:hypothetical protein
LRAEYLARAQHYHEQAEQLRSLAAQDHTPEIKEQTTKLAESYESLYQRFWQRYADQKMSITP